MKICYDSSYLTTLLLERVPKNKTAIGVLVGHIDSTDNVTYIVDVLITPDPLKVQHPIQRESTQPVDYFSSSLAQLLSQTYDQFSFTDWHSEFNLTCDLSLPSGLSCLGICLVNQSSDEPLQLLDRKFSLFMGKIMAVRQDWLNSQQTDEKSHMVEIQTETNKENKQLIFCFDRANGKFNCFECVNQSVLWNFPSKI